MAWNGLGGLLGMDPRRSAQMQQMLMGAGIGLLGQGPSPYPIGIGQSLGAGLGGAMQGQQQFQRNELMDLEKRKLEKDLSKDERGWSGPFTDETTKRRYYISPEGKPEWFDPENDAPKTTGGMMYNEATGQFEEIPGYADQAGRIAAAGRSVTNIDARNMGPIPPGHRLIRGPNGELSMEAIPGSPDALKNTAAEAAAAGAAAGASRNADVVTTDIDRALRLVDDAIIPVTGLGSLASSIPGTSAHDLANLVNTVKSNVGFDRLQEMRKNSPTGGALGPVSDFENKLLQATLGALEQSQSREQFTQNLRRVQQIYNTIIHGPTTESPLVTAPAAPSGPVAAPVTPALPAPPASGTVDGGYMFKGGDPADPKSWVRIP